MFHIIYETAECAEPSWHENWLCFFFFAHLIFIPSSVRSEAHIATVVFACINPKSDEMLTARTIGLLHLR